MLFVHPSRRQLAHHLAPFTARLVADGAGADGARSAVLGLDDQIVDALATRELASLVRGCCELRRRARTLRDAIDDDSRRRALAAVECKLDRALRADPGAADTLWSLLAPSVEATSVSEHRSIRPIRHLRGALERTGAVLVVGATIALVVLVALWVGDRRLGALGVVDLAVIGVVSFLPGWLYVRFIGQRAGAVWDEYVLNLHRLGLDAPQHLPQPPANSEYFRAWVEGGGEILSQHRNIYRQKFDAYYGRSVSRSGQDSRVKNGTLFPILLATVVFAVGWTAVLWNGTFAEAPTTTLEVLGFGFLGAYVFDVQMLARRFFQSDLKPSAYTSAVLRVVVVLIIVMVMHQLPVFSDASSGEEAVVAFVVGLFPIVGLQALNRLAAVLLRGAVPTLRTNYPLSDLEGLNIWYEARLLEEGIEDMQNLVSANMVEVLLHTRVPVGRLVDWHDQALLYLHLRQRRKGRKGDRPGQHPRDVLASFGVRSATTFLKAFPIESVDDRGVWTDQRVKNAVSAIGEPPSELSPAAVMTIARILDDEPALGPVRCWHAGTSPACRNQAPAAARPAVPLHAAIAPRESDSDEVA
jgi:hypothetical protein